MSLIESILYGLLSGFAEFSPISSQAHQKIMKYVFGVSNPIPLFDIFVHLGMLAALIFSCRSLFLKFKRDQNIAQRNLHRKRSRIFTDGIYDVRVIRTASVPMVLMLFLSGIFFRKTPSLITISITLFLNGVMLIISDYVLQGRKEAKSCSALDSLGLGILSGLSGIPGISRVGAGLSFSICRGTSKSTGYNWAILLSAPALFLILVFDFVGLFISGFTGFNFLQLIYALTAFVFSFIGSCASIAFMQYLIVSTGLSVFAFYSWGAGLFSFIIYLLT